MARPYIHSLSLLRALASKDLQVFDSPEKAQRYLTDHYKANRTPKSADEIAREAIDLYERREEIQAERERLKKADRDISISTRTHVTQEEANRIC